MPTIEGRRVLIISMEAFEKSELLYPRSNLQDAGAEVDIASAEMGEIRSMEGLDWSEPVEVDKTFGEVAVGDYDALLIPGGVANPDRMRTQEAAVELVRAFQRAGKPIAAICHGPWMLVEADVVKGRTVTSFPTLRTDLKNAGGEVVDQEVAIDGNLITSRNPDDLPAFTSALIEMISG